jgi:hypothetical protein
LQLFTEFQRLRLCHCVFALNPVIRGNPRSNERALAARLELFPGPSQHKDERQKADPNEARRGVASGQLAWDHQD